MIHSLLLFIAAMLAGAINSVAGGGTLLTFPALLSVLGPGQSVIASATSTVALVPGSLSAFWGYRNEMHGTDRSDLIRMGIPSLIGGLLGACLVVKTGSKMFSHLVPWLIFGATALFIVQEPVRHWQTKQRDAPAAEQKVTGAAMVFQFIVALYGGFFGAGIGILMLASLGLMGRSDIHRMNGLKNFAAVCINGVAALTFIVMHQVDWPRALLMSVAAIGGGYGGAGIARRLGRQNVRRFVIFLGISMGLYTLLKPF